MAHYAKVKNGIVSQVIVADEDFFNSFIDNIAGKWVKTSYNMKGGVYYNFENSKPADDQSVINGDEARERKNFAGVGFNYDGKGFYSKQPYSSWILDATTYKWNSPVAYPDDGKEYYWDEATTNWVEVT